VGGREEMSAAILVISAFILFCLGYFLYGGFIERRLISPEPDKDTPAYEFRDEIDYTPAKTPMLFGNHFASIAGAGPIIGPLVALSCFGWLATVCWIVLGTIFLGAVHDYLALMVSVRNKGLSMAQVAASAIGARAKCLFSIFLWLALILVISVFGVVGAKTLVVKPELVLPTFGIIPVAALLGILVYRLKASLFFSTTIGLTFMFALIYVGYKVPLRIPSFFGMDPHSIWFILLMLYCLLASLLPMWLLMQPRDYLCLAQLILCLGVGYVGLFLANPKISAPICTGASSVKGPIWPMLFVIVACGAISGFHSLVAAGTSSKQLANETRGRLIGYGGMVMEGVLAVLCLVVASAGLKWGKELTTEQFGLQASLERGWIFAFGQGYGKILSDAFPIITASIASLFGMTMIKTFVMTSLDDGTRLARFIVSETLGERLPIFKSRMTGSVTTIVPAFYLGFTNAWERIWPVFGAANQLIAALTLIVISSYLLGVKRPTPYTLIPALFMVATTIGALLYLSFNPKNGFITISGNLLLGAVSIGLILLALLLIADGVRVFLRGRS
jgi:carbon starvation protein